MNEMPSCAQVEKTKEERNHMLAGCVPLVPGTNHVTYKIAVRLNGSSFLSLVACAGILVLAGCATQVSYVYHRPAHQTHVGLILAEGYPVHSLGYTGLTPAYPCLEANLAPTTQLTAGALITRVWEKSYPINSVAYYNAGSFFYRDLASALLSMGEKKGLVMQDMSSAFFHENFHGKTIKTLLDNLSAEEADGFWIFLYTLSEGVHEHRTEYGYYYNKIITTTYEGLTATVYPLFLENATRNPSISLPPKTIAVKRKAGEPLEDVRERLVDETVGLLKDSIV